MTSNHPYIVLIMRKCSTIEEPKVKSETVFSKSIYPQCREKTRWSDQY